MIAAMRQGRVSAGKNEEGRTQTRRAHRGRGLGGHTLLRCTVLVPPAQAPGRPPSPRAPNSRCCRHLPNKPKPSNSPRWGIWEDFTKETPLGWRQMNQLWLWLPSPASQTPPHLPATAMLASLCWAKRFSPPSRFPHTSPSRTEKFSFFLMKAIPRYHSLHFLP